MKKRILIIEDEDYISEMITFALVQEGYETEVAGNGREGLDILKRKKIDLVICDIMMPVMDGYELADSMKENPKLMRIPIIFLTAKTSEEDQIIGRLKGADDYITKPFDTELLLGAIAARLKWVDKYRALSSEVLDDTRCRIFSSLSDEFRNPLMSISGAAESIREHLHDFDNEAVKKFLTIITEQTHRLGQLVEDYLSFAEFELFLDDINKISPLLETLDQCVLANSGEISQRMLSLHKEFPAEEISVAVPRRSLLRIFDRVLHRLVSSARAEEVLTLIVSLTLERENEAEVSFILSDKKLHQMDAQAQNKESKIDLSGESGVVVDLFVVERILQKCGGRMLTQQMQDRINTVRIFLPIAT